MTDDYLDELLAAGESLARMHRELLPLEDVDFGAGTTAARIEPYRSTLPGAAPVPLTAYVRNPFRRPAQAVVRAVVPAGWRAEPAERAVGVGPLGEAAVPFEVCPPPGTVVRRARVAVDVTVGEVRFGQQAEALVSVGCRD